MNNKGVALIGLLVAMAIIGILASVLWYGNSKNGIGISNLSDAQRTIDLAEEAKRLAEERDRQLQDQLDEMDDDGSDENAELQVSYACANDDECMLFREEDFKRVSCCRGCDAEEIDYADPSFIAINAEAYAKYRDARDAQCAGVACLQCAGPVLFTRKDITARCVKSRCEKVVPDAPPTDDEPSSGVHTCEPEARDADVCIQVYQPVCGKVNIQCITTPCDPIDQTFSNSCEACKNSLVASYTDGECSGS